MGKIHVFNKTAFAHKSVPITRFDVHIPLDVSPHDCLWSFRTPAGKAVLHTFHDASSVCDLAKHAENREMGGSLKHIMVAYDKAMNGADSVHVLQGDSISWKVVWTVVHHGVLLKHSYTAIPSSWPIETPLRVFIRHPIEFSAVQTLEDAREEIH